MRAKKRLWVSADLRSLAKISVLSLGSVWLNACSNLQNSSANAQLAQQVPTGVNLSANNQVSHAVLAEQITGLKNSINFLVVKQGVFAGQDQVGNPSFRYQRWQVPVVLAALVDVERNYFGHFNDVFPQLAVAHHSPTAQMLELLYQINNWDTLPLSEQQPVCQLTEHCFFIDDRLWWVNTYLSYAEGLASRNSADPLIDQLVSYAYQIYINGISRPEYVNELATPGAKSVMWYSAPSTPAEYKATISNSLYVTAGARLAKLIRDRYGKHTQRFNYQFVLRAAQSVADGYFLTYAFKLQDQGLLLDGIGTGGSKSPRNDPVGVVVKQMFTYNQGVVLPGMAILSLLTGNQRYLNFAKNLVRATYQFSQSQHNFWDDYGYTQANGWFNDSDGIGFRLSYWEYFDLFLENYDLSRDSNFNQLLVALVDSNVAQLVIRPLNLNLPANSGQNQPMLASPNHNNWPTPGQGKLFSGYPDGYSVPGIAAAMEILLVQQRLHAGLKLN